jgi:hypothetical protein
MNYNPSPWISERTIRQMARWEIHKRFGIKQALWWRFMPGTIIEVKWPNGWVVLDEQPDGSCVSADSSDPNDHYRPWLEKNVGKQGWDWDWRVGHVTLYDDHQSDTLLIKIRHKYRNTAIIAKLKWS